MCDVTPTGNIICLGENPKLKVYPELLPGSPGSDYHTLSKRLHQSLLSPISNFCN